VERISLPYRPDIDGLRAIAVVAVVFYHAGVPGFGGGYVGVDVFFVISGYLITQLLAGSPAAPLPTSLTDFYLRRGRRILPALLVTSLVTAAGGIALLLPWDLQRFGEYLAASSVFLSNMPAWTLRADYFDSRTVYAPLTHFWSIAVEEQFYLVFPLLLIVIGKAVPNWRRTILAVLATASFIASVWASYRHPVANFFLAPTRAWELLLGAMLALWAVPGMRARHAEFMSIAALAILAIVICSYASTMRYPGLYTIAPCTASAVMILAGSRQSTWVSRLLSQRALVFTGLISFSLYLWHLPVMVLFGYFHIQNLGAAGKCALLLAVYLIASLSWKFIEGPIRSRRILKSERSFLICAACADALVLIIGVTLWNSNGFPSRFPAELADLDRNWLPSASTIVGCAKVSLERMASGDLCSYGTATDPAQRVLVWGDSHAMVLLPAYEQLAKSDNLRIYFAVKPACRPLIGVANKADSAARQADCANFNAATLRAIERIDPRLVILNAHWIDANSDLVPDAHSFASGDVPNFKHGLESTLRGIAADHRAVCAVLDVPTFKYSVPYAVAMARRRGISEDFLKLTREEAEAQFSDPERDFLALRQDGRVRIADLKDPLCRGGFCAYEADGALLYADRDHLSVVGARFVARTLESCLQDSGALGVQRGYLDGAAEASHADKSRPSSPANFSMSSR
jgi:peptidoglycan/LPS O-acetylase OafA/YrhL